MLGAILSTLRANRRVVQRIGLVNAGRSWCDFFCAEDRDRILMADRLAGRLMGNGLGRPVASGYGTDS